jgi:RNA polymerase sigma-70 factor, ECF subfamily
MWTRDTPPPCACPITAASYGGADFEASRAEPPPHDTSGHMPELGAEGGCAPLPAEWFHAHVERLWRVVARLGVPRHSIDDIVQEAFIIASRRQADIGDGQERSFLIATAIRLCSNYRQRAHVRHEVSRGDGFEHDASPTPDAEQLLIEKRSRILLDHLLTQMTDTHRTLFVLYELEGFSVPEIANLLDLPVGTVSSRVWRARAKFSELAASLRGVAERDEP